MTREETTRRNTMQNEINCGAKMDGERKKVGINE